MVSTRTALRLLALVVCVMSVGVAARAQPGQTYTFNVDTKFTAANKTFEAGRYEARFDGAGGFIVRGSKSQGRIPVITRLARMSQDSQPRFVFDRLETGEQILSEIWLPGEDGYLVCTLEKQHNHVSVQGQKKGPS
jgi:hypothetical protein